MELLPRPEGFKIKILESLEIALEMCGAEKQKMHATLSGMTSLNAIQFCFMIDDNDQTCQLFDEVEFPVHAKKTWKE